MKRVCSLICLLFLMLAMVLPVNAEETAKSEDSVTIPEDILACLDMETVDTVFRVYAFTDSFLGFATYDDIDGVLANAAESQLQIYYFVQDKQREAASYTYDGAKLIQTGNQFGWMSDWFAIHNEQTETILEKVSADIAVENVYYLRYSGWSDSWSAVYYKTNLGDYVYIRSEQKDYLMRVDQFVVMQNVMLDRYELIWDRLAGMLGPGIVVTPESAPVDLSPYDITSPDFDPHAPLKTNFKPGKFIAIGSFVLFIALVVGRFLIRGHGKYREKKERMASRI